MNPDKEELVMPSRLRSFVLCGLSVALGLVVAGVSSAAEPEVINAVRITVEADIPAPPAAVWKQLTVGKNLVTWCPLWSAEGNASVDLTQVGDVLDFTDSYGNGGVSVVTYIDPGKEIRVAHEPTDGSYMCESTLRIAPTEKGTHVAYVEIYTDESPATDRTATAEKSQKEMNDTLEALAKNIQSE